MIVGQDRPPATATAAEIQLLAEFGEDNLRHFVTIDGALQALDLRRPALYEECLAAGPDDRRRQAWRRQAAAYLTVYGELEDYIRYHGRGLLAERFLVGSDADLRDSRRLRIYFDNQTHLLAEKVDLIVGFKDDERTCPLRSRIRRGAAGQPAPGAQGYLRPAGLMVRHGAQPPPAGRQYRPAVRRLRPQVRRPPAAAGRASRFGLEDPAWATPAPLKIGSNIGVNTKC